MSASQIASHVDRLAALASRPIAVGQRRIVVGIAGKPGSGKTTLAQSVVEDLEDRGVGAVEVPMDGFHLADVQLDVLGLRAWKGRIDTFDVFGYLNLLERVATVRDEPVYAPGFDRRIEQPIAASVSVTRDVRVVVTEGNYLLDRSEPWSRIPALLTETWYCAAEDGPRLARLAARHRRFGKSAAEAREWVSRVDEPNGERAEACRGHADHVIEW